MSDGGLYEQGQGIIRERLDTPEDVERPQGWRATGWTRRLEGLPLRVYLLRDLAAGMSQLACSRKYGVAQQSISAFAIRHQDELAELVGQVENELAGVWLATKAARVIELAADAERVNFEIERLLDQYEERGWLDDKGLPARVVPADLLSVKRQAIRAIAEELGQLVQRVDATVNTRYEVVGIDPEDLK